VTDVEKMQVMMLVDELDLDGTLGIGEDAE
jgi:hypothetical protein